MSDGVSNAESFRSYDSLRLALANELMSRGYQQCQWSAKMRSRAGQPLPGFYCCALESGHLPKEHLLSSTSHAAGDVVLEWVDATGTTPPVLAPEPSPIASKPIGRKDDSGKLRYDLVDPFALAWLVASLTYGVVKYSAGNWAFVEDWRERYYSALERHIEAWRAGEDDDDESGLPHLANAMFCVMCLTAMSAPRDLKVVTARTKEAIRRWRELKAKEGSGT